MKKIVTWAAFLMLLAFPLMTHADKAKTILDKTASIIKKAGDMEVGFSATSFLGDSEQGNTAGNIYLHERQIYLQSTGVTCWYDGTTLWTLNKASNEVNISVPSLYEQQSMNPYLFIKLYREGFKYELSEETLRGKSCYNIRLTATKSVQKIQEMILSIDKSTFLPLCIRMRQGKRNWTRISVLNCKLHQKFSASMFRFNKSDYPKVEVIDLR